MLVNLKDETVVRSYLDLIEVIAKSYASSSFEVEELFQEGCLGFILANATYSADNQDFADYATSFIIAKMDEFMKKQVEFNATKDIMSEKFLQKNRHNDLDNINLRVDLMRALSNVGLSSEKLKEVFITFGIIEDKSCQYDIDDELMENIFPKVASMLSNYDEPKRKSLK